MQRVSKGVQHKVGNIYSIVLWRESDRYKVFLQPVGTFFNGCVGDKGAVVRRTAAFVFNPQIDRVGCCFRRKELGLL